MAKKHLEGLFSQMVSSEKPQPKIEEKPKQDKTTKIQTLQKSASKVLTSGVAGRPRSVLIPDELWAKAIDYKFTHRLDSINAVVRLALEKFLG